MSSYLAIRDTQCSWVLTILILPDSSELLIVESTRNRPIRNCFQGPNVLNRAQRVLIRSNPRIFVSSLSDSDSDSFILISTRLRLQLHLHLHLPTETHNLHLQRQHTTYTMAQYTLPPLPYAYDVSPSTPYHPHTTHPHTTHKD